MDDLRVILLVLGAVIIGGVILWSRRKRAEPNNSGELKRHAEALERDLPLHVHAHRDEADDVTSVHLHVDSEEAEAPEPVKPKVRPQHGPREMLVVLHVATEPDSQLNGYQIHGALESAGFEFGAMDIYHYFQDIEGQKRVLFSVANMLKPGTLKPKEKDQLSTRGITLFLRLPSLLDGEALLERFFAVADELADSMNVSVLDEARSHLTRQTRQHLREQVRAFELEPLRNKRRT